jgi:hypothetical protein
VTPADKAPQQGADESVKDVKPPSVANAMLVGVRLLQAVYWLVRILNS